MIDFFECCTQVFKKVTQHPFFSCCIEPPVIEGEHFVCSGTTELSTQTYDTYQWYFNGSKINGATEQTLTASETGYYTVKVSLNGLWRTSDQFLFTISTDARLVISPSMVTDINVNNYFQNNDMFICVSTTPGLPFSVSPCYSGNVNVVDPNYYPSNISPCSSNSNVFINTPDTYHFSVTYNSCGGQQISFNQDIVLNYDIQGALLIYGDNLFKNSYVKRYGNGWKIYTDGIGDTSGFHYKENIIWKRKYNDTLKQFEDVIVGVGTHSVIVDTPGIYTYEATGMFGGMTFFVKL